MEDKNYFLLNNSLYDFTKRLVQVVLPALASLYFGLAAIWDFPYGEQVVGSIAVITTFLGVVIGISTTSYKSSGAAYDGSLVVTEQLDGPKQFVLELTSSPEDLEGKESITFKVDQSGLSAGNT